MINKNFGVLTDTNVKKQKSDSFLTNSSKERERQNNVSSGGTFKTDYDKNQYQSAFSDVDKLPTTKNTQPKASYNVNADIAKQRAEFVPLVNNAYAPLMEKAETRKWNMPKSEVEKAQNLLNTWGYTDWWGKPLKVDGILGPKTRGALEKHIWDGIPTQETLDMQRWLNKNGFTDNDGNALKQDGMLGRKTDATVQNAILKLDESAGDKKDDEIAQIRKKLGYDDLLNDAINAQATKYAKPVKKENIGYKLDKIPFSEEDYNKFASLNSDPYFQKVYEDSVKNNVEIKNKPNLQKFDIPYQYKVTDEEVLDEFDMTKINALKGLYNWAMKKGDRLTADKAHKAAVDIRSNAKYNGTGYGENYIDDYIYSDEFDEDAEYYSLVETPLDEMRVKALHSDLVDDIVGSDGLSNMLYGIANNYPNVLTMGAATAIDIISQLLTDFGDGIDKYVPTVQEGDIPINLGDKTYYYRPSDGSIILG